MGAAGGWGWGRFLGGFYLCFEGWVKKKQKKKEKPSPPELCHPQPRQRAGRGAQGPSGAPRAPPSRPPQLHASRGRGAPSPATSVQSTNSKLSVFKPINKGEKTNHRDFSEPVSYRPSAPGAGSCPGRGGLWRVGVCSSPHSITAALRPGERGLLGGPAAAPKDDPGAPRPLQRKDRKPSALFSLYFFFL